jgi:hypothetical protein
VWRPRRRGLKAATLAQTPPERPADLAPAPAGRALGTLA